MITQIFNQNILKILTTLSISPGSRFQRKEIQAKTKLNNVTLDESLNILLSSNIIKKDKTLIHLNLDNKELLELIKSEHKKLNELYTPAYFSITDLSSYLSTLKNIRVYLFGSHSKLIHNENSDIDIAIISNNINQEQKDNINNAIRKIEKRYKLPVEIHYFSNNFYKNKSDPLVKDILKNGRELI